MYPSHKIRYDAHRRRWETVFNHTCDLDNKDMYMRLSVNESVLNLIWNFIRDTALSLWGHKRNQTLIYDRWNRRFWQNHRLQSEDAGFFLRRHCVISSASHTKSFCFFDKEKKTKKKRLSISSWSVSEKAPLLWLNLWFWQVRRLKTKSTKTPHSENICPLKGRFHTLRCLINTPQNIRENFILLWTSISSFGCPHFPTTKGLSAFETSLSSDVAEAWVKTNTECHVAAPKALSPLWSL